MLDPIHNQSTSNQSALANPVPVKIQQYLHSYSGTTDKDKGTSH